jgi:hypothetical protein
MAAAGIFAQIHYLQHFLPWIRISYLASARSLMSRSRSLLAAAAVSRRLILLPPLSIKAVDEDMLANSMGFFC